MSDGEAIGFVFHPRAKHVAEAGRSRAEELGIPTWTAASNPGRAMVEHGAGTRLVVTVGGDGTFLYGARLAAPLGIPVLGVNCGRLGFLTDVEASDLPRAVDDVVAGRHTFQRRLLFDVQASSVDGVVGLDGPALNDVVIKARGVGVVRIRVEVDGELLGDFDSDGVVVATATGSTAYAMSAGGPAIDPRVPAIVVVPLAPHAVISRAVVLPEDVSVVVTVVRGQVFVASDGYDEVELGSGAHVEVRPGPLLSVVALSDSPSFQRRLREKVRFGIPVRGPVDDAAHRAERLQER